MDFNQIKFFLALAETLNFTRAAEQCNVSQPGLTNAIKKLEDELGGALVYRDGKNTRLTELGRTLRSQFENIDNLRRQIRSASRLFKSGKTEELNIGLMCTIGPAILSRFLDTFQEEHPRLVIYLHDVPPASIPNLLRSGALDVAFCGRNGPQQPSLEYQPLFDEDMIVAFSDDHPFRERNVVPMIDIAHERYLDRLRCEFRDFFLEFVEQQQIELDVAFASEREDWILDMVEAGVGVSVIPRFSVVNRRLTARPIVEPELTRSVEIVFARRRDPAPAVTALVQKAESYDWAADLSAEILRR